MKYCKFKCMDCGHVLIGNKDGLNCPECHGPVAPIGEATEAEIIKYRRQINKGKVLGMDYKEVLNKQIEVLEKLQEENTAGKALKPEQRIEDAVKLAEEIRLLCDDAKRIMK